MLEPRSPGVSPVFPEHAHQARGEQGRVRVGLPSPAEDVERERMLFIFWREQERLVYPAPRDKGQHGLDQVAVRVDQGQALASTQVLDDQIGEQG